MLGAAPRLLVTLHDTRIKNNNNDTTTTTTTTVKYATSYLEAGLYSFVLTQVVERQVETKPIKLTLFLV